MRRRDSNRPASCGSCRGRGGLIYYAAGRVAAISFSAIVPASRFGQDGYGFISFGYMRNYSNDAIIIQT
jgi:hypothetical protein